MNDLVAFLRFLVGLGLGYLVGSIPTAYIFAKAARGIDIRQHGSGNVGATNAFRVLGKGAGTMVLLLDICKGLLAATLVGDLFGNGRIVARILIASSAVIGHNWTIFLNFKGGKGIATSLGVLIGLAVMIPSIRPVLSLTILTWLTVFFIKGYVSLSSIIASILLPVYMTLFHSGFPLILLGVIFCIFIVFKHFPNIKRLRDRKESRVNLPWFNHHPMT